MKFNKNKKSNIYIRRGLDSNSIGEKKSITFLVLNLDIINYSLPCIGATCLWFNERVHPKYKSNFSVCNLGQAVVFFRTLF